MEVLLHTAGFGALVKQQQELKGGSYVLHIYDQSISQKNEYIVQVSAKELSRVLAGLSTGCGLVRICCHNDWSFLRCDAGNMIFGSLEPAATNGRNSSSNNKKQRILPGGPGSATQAAAAIGTNMSAAMAAAAGIAPTWQSNTYATVQLIRSKQDDVDLDIDAPKYCVFRIDGVYLLKKLGITKKMVKADKAYVEVSYDGFKCKRNKKDGSVVYRVEEDGTETLVGVKPVLERSADDGDQVDEDEEDDDAKELRSRLGKQLEGSNNSEWEDDGTYVSWEPTAVVWTYSAAGTSSKVVDKFPIIDRRAEYKEKGANLAVDPTAVSSDEGFDVENPLGERTDLELGIDNRSTYSAELFVFPELIGEPPASFTYSLERLNMVMKASGFSRYITVHISPEEPANGAFWACVPHGDSVSKGVMHALIGASDTKNL